MLQKNSSIFSAFAKLKLAGNVLHDVLDGGNCRKYNVSDHVGQEKNIGFSTSYGIAKALDLCAKKSKWSLWND
jgi:hypothetical protein